MIKKEAIIKNVCNVKLIRTPLKFRKKALLALLLPAFIVACGGSDSNNGHPNNPTEKPDVPKNSNDKDKDNSEGEGNKELKGWYVHPTRGKENAKGTKDDPWDLQTALNGGPTGKEVLAGDNIWLLEGQYNGRYTASLKSNDPKKPITVSSYPGQWAVINGNIGEQDERNYILKVDSNNTIFKDFEITYVGSFNRDKYKSTNEQMANTALNHTTGEDCKFINLVIHDNPGSGVGSWKSTGGTEFYGNLVYNNGYLNSAPKQRLNHGPAFYVQNNSDKTRLFENNVVFNNFTFGYEIWSASSNANGKEYVKNISVLDNSIFNNSLGFHSAQADIVISSRDTKGTNAPKNIVVRGSEVYKNGYKPGGGTGGYGTAIRLNEYSDMVSPLKDIVIEDNLLMSGNQALVIGKTDSLTFRNNMLVTYGITIRKPAHELNRYKDWVFDNNTYYTGAYYKGVSRFVTIDNKVAHQYLFDAWQKPPFNLDKNSTLVNDKVRPALPLSSQQRIKIVRNKYKPNRFKVSVFYGDGENMSNDIPVDFSEVPGIKEYINKNYKVIDVENYPNVMKTGMLQTDNKIWVNLSSTEFNYPRGYNLGEHKFQKTFKNYGVFFVDFIEK